MREEGMDLNRPRGPGAVSMGTQIPWLPGSTASAHSLPHLGGHRNSALISSLSKSWLMRTAPTPAVPAEQGKEGGSATLAEGI